MAIINRLTVHQFRNLNNQIIEPNQNINLFIGDNAQGKTNLIEAIYYLAHNRSFKTKSTKEIIHFNHDRFQLNAQINQDKVKLEKSNHKSIININQQKVNNTSQLSRLLPIQIITPDKGFVVNGTPKNKRSYLDWGVFHVKLGFATTVKTYNKVLKNINTLLVRQQSDELEFWFLKLAESAAKINQDRVEYCQQLEQVLLSNPPLLFSTLVENTNQLDFKFHSGWPQAVDENNSNNIYTYLCKNKHSLLKTKHLNYGSHKANIDFSFDQRKECFLSRGEQKTLSLIFWLAQVLFLVKLKIKPIVLIDDISSELDNQKINLVLAYLSHLKVQTFMTDIGHNLSAFENVNPTVFQIENGCVQPINSSN